MADARRASGKAHAVDDRQLGESLWGEWRDLSQG
jgi:hypothetical protein